MNAVINPLLTQNPALKAAEHERSRLIRSIASKVCLVAAAVFFVSAFCMMGGLVPVASSLIAYLALAGGLLAQKGAAYFGSAMEHYAYLRNFERGVAAKVQGGDYLTARIAQYEEERANIIASSQQLLAQRDASDLDQASRVNNHWAHCQRAAHISLQIALCRAVQEDPSIPFTQVTDPRLGQIAGKSFSVYEYDRLYHPNHNVFYSAENLRLDFEAIQENNFDFHPFINAARQRLNLAPRP